LNDFSLIVIGASAGGIDTLVKLVARLPANLPAAICVAVHFPSYSTSVLPRILSRAGPLPAEHAVDGGDLLPGHIFIAPPDRHLLVNRNRVRLSRGPRVHSVRPAIDPLFRSAAQWFGRRAIGVVLSGMLDDGTLGLLAIKRHGGQAVVQSPNEALFSAMPLNAINAMPVDHVVSIEAIGELLMRLATESLTLPLPPNGFEQEELGAMEHELDEDNETEIIALGKAEQEQGLRAGQPSMFTCPDCGGVLWELSEGDALHYRCHVGHAYSADSLEAEQTNVIEGALWAAVRLLEENASLSRRLAHRARESSHKRSEQQFANRAVDNERRAAQLKTLLLRGDWATIDPKDTQELISNLPEVP
jgi:two-component system chemotaxis response regulator CheB